MSDEDVPAIANRVEDLPQYPDSSDLPQNVALPTLQKRDYELAQFSLQAIGAAFNHCDTIPMMLKLLKATQEAVKFRRDVLGLPYGHIDKGPKELELEPLP